MKILVIGSEGQLGGEIKKLTSQTPSHEFQFTTLEELDVTNSSQLATIIKSENWNFVVNCTAYTAVDNAEDDPAKCHAINAEAVGNIGKFSKQIDANVIHVSTDYVFDGTAHLPYKETDAVNPVSVYGKTKAEGEELLMRQNPHSIILRTSWLYSEFGNNFCKTMLHLGKEKDKLQVVFDQIGTPTYAEDLASAIMHIITSSGTDNKHFVPGIYHFSNEGVASWYDFAKAIFEIQGIPCNVEPVTSKVFPTKATRPHYSVLEKSKIKTIFEVDVPYWRDSLKRCLYNLQ